MAKIELAKPTPQPVPHQITAPKRADAKAERKIAIKS